MDLSIERSDQARAQLPRRRRRPILGAQQPSLILRRQSIRSTVDPPPTPDNLQGFALGVRGPGHRRLAELPRHRHLDPGVRRGHCTRSRRTGDANVLATPHILAHRQRGRRDQRRREHPAADQRRRRALVARRARRCRRRGCRGALGALGGLGLGGGFVGRRGRTSARRSRSCRTSTTPTRFASSSPRRSRERGAPSGSARRDPDQQAHRADHEARRARSADGGHRRPRCATRSPRSETEGPRSSATSRCSALLFRKSTKTTQKTNLLLVLTPYVIRDQDDLRTIFERKMQERQEFLDRYFVFSDQQPLRAAEGLLARQRPGRGHPPVVPDAEERMRLEEETQATARFAPTKPSSPSAPLIRPAVAGRPEPLPLQQHRGSAQPVASGPPLPPRPLPPRPVPLPAARPTRPARNAAQPRAKARRPASDHPRSSRSERRLQLAGGVMEQLISARSWSGGACVTAERLEALFAHAAREGAEL